MTLARSRRPICSGIEDELGYTDSFVATAVRPSSFPKSQRRDQLLDDGDRIEVVADAEADVLVCTQLKLSAMPGASRYPSPAVLTTVKASRYGCRDRVAATEVEQRAFGPGFFSIIRSLGVLCLNTADVIR